MLVLALLLLLLCCVESLLTRVPMTVNGAWLA